MDYNNGDFLLYEEVVVELSDIEAAANNVDDQEERTQSSPSNRNDFDYEPPINCNTFNNDSEEENNIDCMVEEVEMEEIGVHRTRRRKGGVIKEDWARNDKKKKRECGLPYYGVQKKKKDGDETEWNYKVEKAGKEIKPNCKCKMSEKTSLQCRLIPENSRRKLHKDFWQLSWEEKKVYVCSLIDLDLTSRARDRKEMDESRRNFSFKFYLKTGEKRFRVCKTMFLNTLCIGEWSVRNWKIRQIGENNSDISPPTKKARLLPISERRHAVIEWLNSLPKAESHYCRATSSKLYLEPFWTTKAELYRFYLQEMQRSDKQTVSNTVFDEEFDKANLKLFRPKKDQCDVCESNRLGTLSEEEFSIHRLRADEARLQKDIDKADVKSYNHMFMVDVQSVLLAPRNNISSMYYKTKLTVHNYSILDVHSKQGTLYVWHESNGGLTADVFASILCSFLHDHTQRGETVLIHSDGCAYQNRNSTLSTALSNLASELEIVIIHKYLEPGHTQMEVDSIHSTIEHKLRGRTINVPADYIPLMESAKVQTPKYKVNYLDYTFFKNFKGLTHLPSIHPPPTETGAAAPYVTDIRALKYVPNGEIFYKLRHTEEFRSMRAQRPRRNKPKGVVKKFEDLPALYSAPIPIKKSKFDHLQQLKSCIASDYHNFYDTLPYS